jgi:biotin carboxylase
MISFTSFMPDQRILVVGTTADYIDAIRCRFPKTAVFLTDYDQRTTATEPIPEPDEEILADLNDFGSARDALLRFMAQRKINLCGICCFDCESLELSAYLAGNLGLRFSSVKSVLRCRNKFISKKYWSQSGISCPRAIIVNDNAQLENALDFFSGSVVLKPLTGSGSELIYRCDTPVEAKSAFQIIRRQLAVHPDKRMYGKTDAPNSALFGRRDLVVEEFIDGKEFSCDFILNEGRLDVIRLASKISDPQQSFGTTLAYVVPGQGFLSEHREPLRKLLYGGARALGLESAICMADVMVAKNTLYLLELTPRLGGDCLPQLIMDSSGLDGIALVLHFSAGRPYPIPKKNEWKTRVGLRILASDTGEVEEVDVREVLEDQRVVSYQLKAFPGYQIELPPKDYDSRILGHVIFRPDNSSPIEFQCRSLLSKCHIKIRKT